MVVKIAGVAGLALALAGGTAASAQSPAPAMMSHGMSDDVSSMDCSTAMSHMAALMHPAGGEGAMKAPIDADHAFADEATTMMAHQMTLAKIEVKCGKNPKAVEAAKKMQSQLEKMVFGTLF